MVSHGREHIARHFIKELMEVVSEFPDPTACPECNYRYNMKKCTVVVTSYISQINNNLFKYAYYFYFLLEERSHKKLLDISR